MNRLMWCRAMSVFMLTAAVSAQGWESIRFDHYVEPDHVARWSRGSHDAAVEVRVLAAVVLAKSGPPGIQALLRASREHPHSCAGVAAWALRFAPGAVPGDAWSRLEEVGDSSAQRLMLETVSLRGPDSPEAIGVWERALLGSDELAQEVALEHAGRMDPNLERLLSVGAQLLQSKSPSTRKRTALTLAQASSLPEAIRTRLIALLDDANGGVRDAAVHALHAHREIRGELADRVVEGVLMRRLGERAIQALGELPEVSADSRSALKRWMADVDPYYQYLAAGAAVRLGDFSDGAVRLTARWAHAGIRALGADTYMLHPKSGCAVLEGVPQAVQVLVGFLSREGPDAYIAVVVLPKLAVPADSYMPVLTQMVASNHPLSDRILKGLRLNRSTSREVRAVAKKALDRAAGHGRVEAAELLWMWPEERERALRVLVEALRDDALRAAAAWALCRLGPQDERAVSALSETLGQSRDRRELALALGACGGKSRRAFRALAGLLEDVDPGAVGAAIPALAKLRDQKAEVGPVLAGMLSGPRRMEAARALGELGWTDPHVLDRLREGALSEDPVWAGRSADVLGRLGGDLRGAYLAGLPKSAAVVGLGKLGGEDRASSRALLALLRDGPLRCDVLWACGRVVLDADAQTLERLSALFAAGGE